MFKKILLILLAALLAIVFSSGSAVVLEGTTLTKEAGFEMIEPVDFYFHFGSYFDRLAQRSSEARIWYVFQPADFDADNRPLFVFFNGGPGSATSCGLLSMYTSHYTLDNTLENGGDAFIPNPLSWTRMGNLLYIDARTTGFSYSLMEGAADYQNRLMEFNSQNYNGFFDAADFIRVLLRFLSRHPQLQDNPVVIVGESYGGARAALMLHLLLNYRDFGNGVQIYQDPALASEIQTHYDVIFPAYQGEEVPSRIIAGQFGHQVLIQPAVVQYYQGVIEEEMLHRPGSVLYQLAEEVGAVYDPNLYPYATTFVREVAQRDPYNYSQPYGWLTGFFANAGNMLRLVDNLTLVTGVNVRNISALYASARMEAYKILDLSQNAPSQVQPSDPSDYLNFRTLANSEARLLANEPGDLSRVFGYLLPWDQYFLSSNSGANTAFHYRNIALYRGYEAHPYDHLAGWMAVWNMAYVETFITNAAYDLVVYTEAIPPSIAHYSELVEAVQRSSNPGVERSEILRVRLRPDAFPALSNYERIIRFPSYSKSCHAVPLTEPWEFYTDVRSWLIQTGLPLDIND